MPSRPTQAILIGGPHDGRVFALGPTPPAWGAEPTGEGELYVRDCSRELNPDLAVFVYNEATVERDEDDA